MQQSIVQSNTSEDKQTEKDMLTSKAKKTLSVRIYICICVCVCACVSECVCACVSECVRACVCVISLSPFSSLLFH